MVPVIIPRAALPSLDDDEFYYSDVEGATVYCDGQEAGRVLRIHDGGGADILEIETPSGVRFVPSLPDNVVDLDVDLRRLTLADGALD